VVLAASTRGFEEFGLAAPGRPTDRARTRVVASALRAEPEALGAPVALKPELLKTGAFGVVRGGFRRIHARI